MTMHSTDSLERVLTEQLSLYEQYLDLLGKDSDLMARLRIDELEKNAKVKTTIFLKLQAMDEARKAALKQLAGQMNLPNEVRLETLCRQLPQVQATRLLDLKKKLQAVIDRAKGLQGRVSGLANSSLTWINASMASLQGLMSSVPVYGSQGKVTDNHSFQGVHVERRI